MNYVLIVYESRTGNTRLMAEAVADGVISTGLESKLVDVKDATQTDMLNAAGIIVGSYTSYGILAGGTKEFFDRSVKIHRKLQGKVGGAFASSGELGGGNEATVLSILQMMLVHGMIIQGDSTAPHFGAVAIGKPNAKNLKSCRDLGMRVAGLIKALDHS
jgi:NAD(P)H dehydrogenase (quinone)